MKKDREVLKASRHFINEKKGVIHLHYVQMAYIMPMVSKITKIHELPLSHRGSNWKQTKKRQKELRRLKGAGGEQCRKLEQWH